MKFNHLKVPGQWKHYWSRYPEGYTIIEALITWVSQVDDMVDNQNTLNQRVDNFDLKLEDFLDQYDGKLKATIEVTLGEWQDTGFLNAVINEALQWQLDDYITTNEQEKLSLTTQLQQTDGRISTIVANAGDNTLPSEVVDMRVVGSKTYPTAGDALRAVSNGTGLADQAVDSHHTTFIRVGKNLFDKSRSVEGYIATDYGLINEHESYNVSDFIRVDPKKDIVITPRARHFLAYDKDKNPIASTYMSTSTNNYTFNTGNTIRYVRFNYYKTEENLTQMEYGTEQTGYEPFGYHIPILNTQDEASLDNPLKDKVIFNLGDSIMAGDGNSGEGVGDIVAYKNSMVLHDWAKGGATIAWDSVDAASTDEQTKRQNIQYQVQQAIASGHSPDYILFNGMTNDINGGSVVPLGEISTGYTDTLDNTTFSGGFEKVVKDLRTAFPDVHILYIRPHNMASRNYDNQVIYGNRALEICEKWSVMAVDLFKYSGLNTFLEAHHKYTGATGSFPEGDRTHPNQLGYEKYYVPHIESAMLEFI